MLYNKSLFEKAYNTLKLKFIYREIQNIENIRILELGVRRGLSTSLFLKTCEDNNGRMISVDIDDCGHLYKNDRWNFICTRDDDYEKIDNEILKIGTGKMPPWGVGNAWIAELIHALIFHAERIELFPTIVVGESFGGCSRIIW